MADDALPLFSSRDLPVRLRDEAGVQWVALPMRVKVGAEDVSIREDRWRLTIEVRRPPPPPRTDEEWAAFWARIDSCKTGGPEDDWPEVDDPPFEDKGLAW